MNRPRLPRHFRKHQKGITLPGLGHPERVIAASIRSLHAGDHFASVEIALLETGQTTEIESESALRLSHRLHIYSSLQIRLPMWRKMASCAGLAQGAILRHIQIQWDCDIDSLLR